MGEATASLPLGRLENGTHVYPVRVFWEDTDGAGIVYYANYLRFIERARTEFLRLLAVSQSDLWREAGMTFAVRSCAIDYLSPARLDDALEVHICLSVVRDASVQACQEVRGESRRSHARWPRLHPPAAGVRPRGPHIAV